MTAEQAAEWMRDYRRNYPHYGPIRAVRVFIDAHGTWTALDIADVTDAYYAADHAAEEATR